MSERKHFGGVVIDGEIVTPPFSVLNQWYERKVELIDTPEIFDYDSYSVLEDAYNDKTSGLIIEE